MKSRDRNTSTKYYKRLMGEFARTYLREIFDFLEVGIPSNWRREKLKQVSVVQSAVRSILEFAYAGRLQLEGRPALENSVNVLEQCLNRPVSISYGTVEYEIREGKARRVSTRLNFHADSYFRRLGELVSKCMNDYHYQVFGEEGILGVCPQCGSLFLRAKANQGCCTRGCINKWYYKQKLERDPNYYRDRGQQNYTYQKRKRTNNIKSKATPFKPAHRI